MKTQLLFDFIVKKEEKTIVVKREFDANLELVWQAWTTPEILDQWWGPEPYRTRTKSMDFREGGMWLYEMYNAETNSEEECHWCKNDYIKIKPQSMFSGLDAFCDENGIPNLTKPRTQWVNQFHENGNKTLVTITLNYDSAEELEKIISLGFREGFTIGLNQLDEVLKTLKSKSK